MAEFIKTAEVVGTVLKTAQKVGQTVLGPFKGGWTNLGERLPPGRPPEATTPKPAKISIYEGEHEDEESTAL